MPTKGNLIPTTVNPDLQKERAAASFSVEEFQQWWHDGPQKLREKREIEQRVFADMDDTFVHEFDSHEGIYTRAVKHTIDAANKLKKLQNEKNPGGTEIYPGLMIGSMSHGLMPANTPLATHLSMFVDVIKSQGTPELVERFGKAAEQCGIIGTYAQTEMAHGTNVRGIETRADYDRHTEEFVLNTPALRAYKWWPGGLGHTANHAMVVAQLYIDGSHKGIQMFIVPLRHSETHMPLPGVDIGEIGKKMGMLAVNQGYLGFKNVRIPRTNMLMKFAKVQPDGTFLQHAVPRVNYLTMVYTRCLLVNQGYDFLLKAATIATRYSAVRRQSPINDNEPEPQIIDHVTQQLKLFPQIAFGMAYKFASANMWEMYNQTYAEINTGEYTRLQELHILACALKVLCTTDSCLGIESLRLACGGHGYLAASNLGNIYGNGVAACTYEGENTVLLLQIGRFLVKAWQSFREGKPPLETVRYFGDFTNMSEFPAWNNSWECLVQALQYTAANKTRIAFENLSKRLAEGQTQPEALNNTGIELTRAAELHGRQAVAQIFLQQITGPKASQRTPALNRVLEYLLELHLVGVVLQNTSDILRFIPLSDSDLKSLQRRLEEALTKLRPEAVAICDGFDFHDVVLNSVLGCYDGNVYERIFESAQKSPMNQKPVPEAFEKYLKPFFKSNL